MKILLSLFAVCLIWNIGFTQKDIEGSQDHPLLTRYPDSYIASYDIEKYREYDLATGPITGYRYIEKREKVAGQLTRISYLLNQPTGDLSITEVYKDYLQAIEKAGISILAKGYFPDRNNKGTVGGGSWIGVALGPQKFPAGFAANYLFAGTSSSGGTFSIVGRIDRPEGPTYLAMYGERHSSKLVVVHVDIIETKGAETGKVTADANYIRKEIDERGSVVIYGISFDFDSSTIKPESKPTIAEIAKFLKVNSGIALYVVGHTDMKGTLEYNLRLSKSRAKAVVQALINDHDIKADRLISDGVAFLAPKASNATDEGRAINRRTELVKRN